MANKDDYLAVYQRFFECFAQTVNPNDQLPVKLASYKLVNLEVVGGIIDWTTQYLTQKQCPPNLLASLIKIVIEEIRKSCKKNPVSCGYNTSAEVYEPLKLMQAVMAKTNEVCLRYMDNSMLCSLPTPGPLLYVVSVAAIKNTRRKMEDRHVVIHDLNTMFNIQEASPSSYYAIFDGHAGHDAAAYSAVHLHQFLAESKHFVNNPEQALIDAFYKTDSLFIDKQEKFCSGTTAVCALLKPKERMMYIAWVGDSQALIVSKGVLYQCVVPHKPGREDEKDRIEQQGGVVVYWGTWRVNGQLAVSRAIGDREYKPYVTAIPEVQEIPITGNSDFVILACDGLWDFLSEEEAATTVYNMVCTNSDDIDPISHRLVQLAKNQGSTDNISVIVVFLREPSKVAADAHWANRNTTTSLLATTMETGLDNANAANNPFANSNGAEILQQKDDFLLNQPKDDFLMNLTEGFKQNGGAIASPTTNNLHFSNFDMNAANGKRQSIDEFDEDEDMGPETDVDAVDDIPSPLDVKEMMFHQDIQEENQKENAFNPFTDIKEKGAFEVDVDLELQKQQGEEFEVEGAMREETPTPPVDKVHDATVEENVADSGEESEDEWNYFKGNSAAAETSASSLKTDQEVAELTKTIEEDEELDMSQLNPNAAEFVPISSPTRNISSPACRALIDDQVIAQSPRRDTPLDIDINVPNPVEFESEVKNRPSEVFNNGHDNENGHKLSSQEVMENLLNGKNLDEIEFYPSTPSKIMNPNPDEFHFGPNSTPFSTPAKPLDQSEALSTKALFGDESTASYLQGKTLETTLLTESTSPDEKEDTAPLLKLKEQDPMSMSFYQDENEHNPFDMNKVQQLPENIYEFIGNTENGEQNEKENINPEFSNDNLLGISQLPKTPEPENLSESLEEKEDMDVEKDVYTEKDLEVEKDMDLEKDADVEKDIDIEKDMDVQKDMELDKHVVREMEKHVDIEKYIVVEKDVDLEKDMDLEKDIDLEKDMDLEKDIDLEKDMGLEKDIDLDIEKDVDLEKDMDIEKHVDIETDIDLEKICDLPPVISPSLEEVAKQPLPITPEPAESLEDQSISDLQGIVKDIQEIEETDLCKFSESINPPIADVVSTNDYIIDVKKMPEIDSSPETEELSQISDAGDEIPPLCKSPEMTSDLDQFESNIKEVMQDVCQELKPEILPAASEIQMKPIISDLDQLESNIDVEKPEQVLSDIDQAKSNIEVEKSAQITCDIDQLKANVEIEKTEEIISDFDQVESNVEIQKCTELISDLDQVELNIEAEKPVQMTSELVQIESEKSEPITSDLDQVEPNFEIKRNENIAEKIMETEIDNIQMMKPHVDTVEMIPETKIDNMDAMMIEAKVDNVEMMPETKMDNVEMLLEVEEVVNVSTQQKEEDAVEVKLELPTNKMEGERFEPLAEKGEKEHTDKLFETSVELKPTTDDLYDKFESKLEHYHNQDIPKPIEPEDSLFSKPTNEVLVKETNIVDVDIEVGVGEVKGDEKLFDDVRDLDSPMEDVTTSIKDDVSSSEIVEEAKDISTEKEIIQDSFVADNNESILEASQPNMTHQTDVCQPIAEEKTSVAVTDSVKEEIEEACHFLDRSNVPEILSPISPATQPIGNDDDNSIIEQSKAEIVKKSIGLVEAETTSKEMKADEDVQQKATTELIKTDTIAPQYPEEATITTPSEEIKIVEPSDDTIKQKEEIVPKSDDSDKKIVNATVIGSAAAVAAVATGAVVAATTKSKDKKLLDKKPTAKKPTPTKSAATTASSKSTTMKTLAPKPTTTKPLTPPSKSSAPSAKATTAKTQTSKTSPSAIATRTPTKLTTTKLMAKSEGASAGKVPEKKTPLTNGDVKGPTKTTTARKTSMGAKTPSTTPKASVPLKASPTKIDSPKSASKLAPKPATTSKTTTMSTKPRPTTLTSAGAGGATKTATTLKSTVTKTTTITSPKTTTAPPKPKLTSATTARPSRPLSTNTKPKAPDTEKQIKDTVNKQLTTTRTLSAKTATATSRVTSTSTTTVKKTETKAPTTTRTITTKTTAIKATKKPAEITRLAGKAKPAATKAIAKPQENGTAEHVTTVVQETTAILTTEPQLVKDLSPIENKFIIDNLQVTENNVAD